MVLERIFDSSLGVCLDHSLDRLSEKEKTIVLVVIYHQQFPEDYAINGL